MKDWKQLKKTVTRSNYGKDKTVKIALDARKLNDSSVKRPHMPNMEELRNQISAELSRNDHEPIWISVIDLDYAYGQMKLAPETSRHCQFSVTGENMNGYYPFLKGFYGPADIPTIFQEKIDRTLGHQTPVWVAIIIVTRGTKEHTRKLYSELSKLENEGYRASKKKSKFYQKETIWLGHTLSQEGIRSNKEKTRNQQIETPHKHQNSKILPWCHTIFRNFHTQLFRENRQHEIITQERNKIGLDDGPKHGLQQNKQRRNRASQALAKKVANF